MPAYWTGGLPNDAEQVGGKSAALGRQHSKWKLRATRAKVRKEMARQRKDAWDIIRRAVYDREKGRCRAFNIPTHFWKGNDRRGNPLHRAECNHVIFRSAGGSDDMSNLVNLSAVAHEMVHARHPKYLIDIFGNANETLRMVLRHAKTGAFIKEWDAPCR